MHRITKVFRYHRVLKRGGVGHQPRDLVLPSTGKIIISSAEVDAIQSVVDEATASSTAVASTSAPIPSTATSTSAHATPDPIATSIATPPRTDLDSSTAGSSAIAPERSHGKASSSPATVKSADGVVSAMFLALFVAALDSLREERCPQSNEALAESSKFYVCPHVRNNIPNEGPSRRHPAHTAGEPGYPLSGLSERGQHDPWLARRRATRKV